MTQDAVHQCLNPRVTGLAPSATVEINDRSNALIRAGRDVFKLGLGQSPFPVPWVAVERLCRAAREKDYLPSQGLPRLRESIAAHHRRVFGIECAAEDVLIGPGSKELMFLLQLTYDGELVIPSPSWVSYSPQAHIIGRSICRLETRSENRWLLTPSCLDQLCDRETDKPRLLVLNYPSNPVGTTYTEAELDALAEAARARRMLVLSDEIYAKLHHRGAHRSIVPKLHESTIFSGGLSKWCGAGGWRLGVFVFPRELTWLRKAMTAVGTETFTSTCAPIQYAAIAAFEEHAEIDAYLRHSQRILRGLGALLTTRLRAAGAQVHAPAGGFCLFPDFSASRERLAGRGIHGSPEMCARLLADTGVAILPGSEFGRPQGELTARIAYVDFDGGEALKASVQAGADGNEVEPGTGLDAELGEAFFEAHCPRVLSAVERLGEWLS